MNEKIRVQIGGGAGSESQSHFGELNFSKASTSRIKYGTIKDKKYTQRDGDFSIEEKDDIPDLLDADYPSLVETNANLDEHLNAYEVYDQIYSAWHTHQRNDIARIRRRFGHSQVRAEDEKKQRLMAAYAPASATESKPTQLASDALDVGAQKPKTSKLAIKLAKKYSPRGSHITGFMGGASEEKQVRATKERLKRITQQMSKVDRFAVTRYVRENVLNEKFHGTWVAEGLEDEVTKGMLARRLKQPDLVDEIIRADHKGDEWLEKMKTTENFSWVFKDPPVDLGKFYYNFCHRNVKAYNDYKAIGIKKLAGGEASRHEKKELIQQEAKEKGIKEKNMLKYQKQREKEAIWRRAIPDALLAELMQNDKTMQKQMQFSQSAETSQSNSRTKMPFVQPLSNDSSMRGAVGMGINFSSEELQGKKIDVSSADEQVRTNHLPGELDQIDIASVSLGDQVVIKIDEGASADTERSQYQQYQHSTEPAEPTPKSDYHQKQQNRLTLPDFLAKKQTVPDSRQSHISRASRQVRNNSVMSTISVAAQQLQKIHRQSVDFPAQKRLERLPIHSNGSFRLSDKGKMIRTQKAFFNKNSAVMTTTGGVNQPLKAAVNVYSKMQRVPPQSNNFHAPSEAPNLTAPGRRASTHDMARLIERLSVPKNYSRMRYAEENFGRLQSVDWAGGSVITKNLSHRQSNRPNLPNLEQKQQQMSTLGETTAAGSTDLQNNFHKLMSLDFGNNHTRRRQFMNRTIADSFEQHPQLGLSYLLTGGSPSPPAHTREQTAMMNMSMNSKMSKNDLDQMMLFNSTGRSNIFATIQQPPSSLKQKFRVRQNTNLTFASHQQSPKQSSKLTQMKQRQKFIKELAESLSKQSLKKKKIKLQAKSNKRSQQAHAPEPTQNNRYTTMSHSPVNDYNEQEQKRQKPPKPQHLSPQQSPRQLLTSRLNGDLDFQVRQQSQMTQPKHTKLNRQLLNTSSSSFCDAMIVAGSGATSPGNQSPVAYAPQGQSQLSQFKAQAPQMRTVFKQRVSNFELNSGLHKQRSSQLKIIKDSKIHEMMSKIQCTPRMKGAFPATTNQSLKQNQIKVSNAEDEVVHEGEASINGTTLQSYDWVRERAGNATFSNASKTNTSQEAAVLDPGARTQTTSTDDKNGALAQSMESQDLRVQLNKDQLANQEIIQKCINYVSKCEMEDIVRDHDINISIEDYLSERRKYFFELLDEIQTYPAALQKTILNYKINYDDEQEMASREIIQLYKTGATDPRFLLAKLMKEAQENPSSDSDGGDDDGHKEALKKRFQPPNLTCFKKKDNSDEVNAEN